MPVAAKQLTGPPPPAPLLLLALPLLDALPLVLMLDPLLLPEPILVEDVPPSSSGPHAMADSAATEAKHTPKVQRCAFMVRRKSDLNGVVSRGKCRIVCLWKPRPLKLDAIGVLAFLSPVM